jgi:hypothetical protein
MQSSVPLTRGTPAAYAPAAPRVAVRSLRTLACGRSEKTRNGMVFAKSSDKVEPGRFGNPMIPLADSRTRQAGWPSHQKSFRSEIGIRNSDDFGKKEYRSQQSLSAYTGPAFTSRRLSLDRTSRAGEAEA